MTSLNFGNNNNVNLIVESSNCNINLIGTNDISLNLAQLTLNQENIGKIKTSYNTFLDQVKEGTSHEDISYNDLSLNFDVSLN